jgi:hypothetical protein
MTTPIRRFAAALAATVVVALAGCGSHRSGASGAQSRENPNAAPADITSMVACFRAHGMPDWPDPNYDPRDGRWHLDGPPLKAGTRQACASVLPHVTPASPVPSAQFHDLLQYAQCMRANGVPGWPDPTVDGVFVTNLDPKTDPAVQAAEPACQKYLASSGGGIQLRPVDG